MDEGQKRSRMEVMPTPSTHVTPETKKGHVSGDVVPRKLDFSSDDCQGGMNQKVEVSKEEDTSNISNIL